METKPGYLTTEFWTTITLNVLGVAQLVTNSISVNNKYVALGMAIITGLYNGSRGLAKAGVTYNPGQSTQSSNDIVHPPVDPPA